MKRRRTHEERANLREAVTALTRSGRTVGEVADALGISKVYAGRIKREMGFGSGVECRPPMSEAELAAADAMLADGASAAEVARTLGRGATTIRRRFQGRAWSREQCGEWVAINNSVIRDLRRSA